MIDLQRQTRSRFVPPPMTAQPNAEAGPSTALFLKPKGPPQPPPRLASTHDLLARFLLLPAYDKYVRPPPDDPPEPLDNGKGKGRESPAPQTPGDHDPDDDDAAQAKGEKKKKNSYKHLIKGVPGKHSMKKDDYLAGIMQVPPKQRIPIAPFDLKTQREAFSVSLEGLKGWNATALVVESAQAREDRKKRKELKRLAKAQAQLHAAQAAAAAAGSPMPTPAPVGTPRPGTGTPRPGEARSRPSLAPVIVPGRVGTPVRTGTGGATPTSAMRMGTGTPTSAHPRTSTPHPLSAHPVSAAPGPDRPLKREREESNGVGTPVAAAPPMQNGYAGVNGVPPRAPVPVIAASKAGIAGARPRPVKKQRVDMQGQARDVTAVQQQPTPQGV
ncbi:hypothetical protein C8F04DRAFT_1146180 [Mycena alexandri]|uniref:Mediator of RNA polymerase II transcription subunit 19 n=1 Tax=Mycena alexandri TaxID=1745969 RepID=A0AAD6S2A3_9AGAR|nr:hypothetical protein C8F04DRAFT_1146180 [Mycena alexandri]